ncbi:MAG: hypothetical protein Sv326_0032 [Candidatus Fermentimicrarchaeum limneticum]|uniref:Uncharacterized protein n=1 Tax=Fermentimicrarchaeum limneticum TaxID=2795018 RepID=A0A7D5XP25_FERL1|nr:MAG: hypothetical protein Sv326_0032 [Candidatus Fermentimicrarchaeum limneticum]
MALAFQALWSNWQSVAITAAVLSLLFASLAYALSHIFGMRKLELWAKDEIYQALASALIVGAAVIIITGIASFSCTLSGGCVAGNDQVDVAIGIMQRMNQSAIEQLEHIFYLSMRVGMITKMGKFYDFTLGPEGGLCMVGECRTAFGFSWYLWQGGSIIADSIDYTFSILLPLISSFIAQTYMLSFIKASLFPSLLAMGIILRTFFFSRKVGGLLIAIALALYTVYPMMYIMLESYFTIQPHTFYYADTDWFTTQSAGWACGGSFLPEGESDKPFCTGPLGLVAYVIPGLPQAAANYGEATFMFKSGCVAGDPDICPDSTCPPGGVNGQNICDPGNPPDVYAGMKTPYNGVLPTVGYLMIPGVFIPLIIILVTISFIKVLSPMLGGDIEIAGLTRLI